MEFVISSAFFATAIVLVVYFFLRNENHRRREAYRNNAMAEILPNRLQAYERLALYLDRITPETMAIREQLNYTTAKDLHIALINCVRQEFEHNVAMQIYVSSASWQRVLRARQEVLKSLTETLKNVAPTATPTEYAAELVEFSRNNSLFYVERAKEGLRKDVDGKFVNE